MNLSQALRLLEELEGIEQVKDIRRTKVSKQSDELIEEFQNRLAAFQWLIEQRKRLITDDDKKRLFVVFYKYVESQYFLGQEYADRERGMKKPVSKKDIEQIDSLAKQALKDFWNGLRREGVTAYDYNIAFHDIDKLITTHDDYDEVIQREWDKHKKGEVLRPDFMVLLANLQAIHTIQMMQRLSSDTGVKSLNDGTLSNAQRVEFITELDDRVCPICRPLHGRVWNANDPSLIEPARDTHPRCRCRLVVADSG